MFDIRGKYYNYELTPNGRTREHVPDISCPHGWRHLGQTQDEDDETLEHYECTRCEAQCLRDADGVIVEYDCSNIIGQRIELGRGY